MSKRPTLGATVVMSMVVLASLAGCFRDLASTGTGPDGASSGVDAVAQYQTPPQGDDGHLDEQAMGDSASPEGQADVSATALTSALKGLRYTLPEGVNAEMATLDLYRRDDGLIRPLVVLVHGGSWVGGDKANFDVAAPDFIPWWLDRGYVVASVNFRLASKITEPQTVRPTDQASDIAHAIAWLISQGDVHKIAPDAVVLVGYSSGAHLVALLGADGRYLEAAGLAETVLKATVSLDVHAYDVPFALELMVGSVVEENVPLITHLFGETTDEQLLASPIHYAKGWVAPALIVSVDTDPEVVGSYGYLVSQAAENYVSALTAQGHIASSYHDVSETHTSLAVGFGVASDGVTAAVGTFLDLLP
ncbi:MAG: alpha/beta hydrolase fold domain-containing protein [Myxococcota bacterium]